MTLRGALEVLGNAARVAWLRARGARVGRGVRVVGRIWLRGRGVVRIGDGVLLDARELPIEVHAERGGEIVLGEGAEIAGGTSIEAERAVHVGAGARIGRLCKILDTHFHDTRGDRTRRPPASPVSIGSGATIGDRAIVLPGARVREGAVVAARAVVRGTAPSSTAEGGRGRGLAATPPAGGPLRRGIALARTEPLTAVRILIAFARARLAFARPERGRGVRVFGRIRIVREGRLRVGSRTIFLGGMIPAAIVARGAGSVEIGESCVFNYGVSIEASSVPIRIGPRCLFGSMVRIHDRDEERSGPVTIQEDVWLAHGVVIAPGVTVGAGSVVSAGSVVLSDVPPRSLAAGAPARAISLSLAAPKAEKAS